MANYRKTTLEERFWRYVSPEPNSGCWIWDGAVSSNGYGTITVGQKGPGTQLTATHVSLAIHGRPLPKGMFACHSCDFPPCVNPDHLFHGTPKQNTQDSISKGRSRVWNEICRHGHLKAGDNLYIAPSGLRMCKECRRASVRKNNARLRSFAQRGAI